MSVVCGPTVLRATSSTTTMATKLPRYGTNPPRKTTTASSPGVGTPSSTRKAPYATARAADRMAVPRRYPPTRSSASRLLASIRSRFPAGVACSSHSHACTPSRSTKKVRNTVRMPIVAHAATAPASSLIPEAIHDRMPSAANWTHAAASGGSPSAASSSRSSSRPLRMACTMSGALERKARSRRKSTPRTISTAATVTAADALVVDHPRPRRFRINGATVAATITDSRIDAVTVPRRNAVQISTAPRAAMTSSLQLMAPVRCSHRGTERAGSATVTAVIAAQRAYRARNSAITA